MTAVRRQRRMKRIIMLLLCVFWSGCQYGPEEDYSRFKTAALIQAGRTVVFTFHDQVYRPAKGIAAFPDGGIPKYISDRSFLCVLDRSTGTLTKLMEYKNREWTEGSGSLYIVTARGDAVVVSQSGQKRRDLSAFFTRHHILNLATGAHDTFNLADDLLRHGRKKGPLYLGDDNGTLVIITPPHSSDTRLKSSKDKTPQIWVRLMGGRYIFAGTSAHYQGTFSGNVIYWRPEDRQFYAFNIKSGTTTPLEGYRVPEIQQVKKGVRVGASGVGLEIGVRINDVWQYEPLPVDATAVRSL